jgi:hypothetical protein
MTQQQDTRAGSAIAVFAGTLREILETVYRKYPGETGSACPGNRAPSACNPADLEALIVRYSRDEEIRGIPARRFKESGFIINPVLASPSSQVRQRYDLFGDLDERSSSILRILYDHRYATLDELSVFSGLTHYDVLHRLRDIIIPLSVKRRGRPIAVFRESATDLVTGRQIIFSWWLNDDLLNKADEVEVAETDDTLVITLDRTGRDLPETLHASARCKHGILEIKVDKKRPGEYYEEG